MVVDISSLKSGSPDSDSQVSNPLFYAFGCNDELIFMLSVYWGGEKDAVLVNFNYLSVF